MAGAVAASMTDTGGQPRRLYARIGDFLDAHRLVPNPANYAFAFAVMSEPHGALAEAVAQLCDRGIELTESDVRTLTAEHGGGALDPAANEALVARTQLQVEGFEDIVRSMKVEAAGFGDELAAGADALRHRRDMLRVDEVVNLTGAMVARVRSAEDRLEAARREASTLRQELEEARDNARRDPLTDLPNRRAIEEAYAEHVAAGHKCCLAICDIDRFKMINDSFGHMIGDRVLKAIGAALSHACRDQLVARYGGEEFAILFSGVAAGKALKTIEGARKTVAAKRYRLRETNAPIGEITFSAGVTAAVNGEPFNQLFDRTDALLYQAKAAGRNCVKGG